MKAYRLLLIAFLLAAAAQAAPPEAPFASGLAIDLDREVPANERGILALAQGKDGVIYGGTTGRAAHLLAYDPRQDKARSLARLPGGIGLSHGIAVLPDGSLIAGTQADPTGTAVATDPKQVGKLLRLTPQGAAAKVEELGVPVPGQGIYALAYDAASHTVVGLTFPEGHFFHHDVKTGKTVDHGPIAGHRTFETPPHAADLNRGVKEKTFYPRRVSRAIAIVPGLGAVTGGADGHLYSFSFTERKVKKSDLRLPTASGRESYASLDSAVVFPRTSDQGNYTDLVGGTSEGHLFELRVDSAGKPMQLRPRGRAFGQGTIQGLAYQKTKGKDADERKHSLLGVGGAYEGMPRGFTLQMGGGSSGLFPGGIPMADGQNTMVGFGAMMTADDGTIYAGERDRIARLVRYPLGPISPAKPKPKVLHKIPQDAPPLVEEIKKLPGWVVFAPEGTTTDGSGYTAINVGKDGKVYIGATRYGGYAWLLRFDPATRSYIMDRVVNMQDLTGERLSGISTQGKIHAIIIIGPDGRVWFASKQAHEIFGTRPEYGEDDDGYPGGHLCWYDPKTGFSRSMGILKKQEGLMAGAMDNKRNMLYYRSEPKNYFLTFDVTTGKVQDRGHVGAACRYMAIDKEGRVFQPGRGDYLSVYDPTTGYVEDHAVKLEGEGFYQSPYVVRMGPNGKLYGVGINHPWVLEFDVDKLKGGAFPEVTVRNVAPSSPPGVPASDIHAGVFGQDGKLYYTNHTQAVIAKGKTQEQLRIMRFDPATKKVETVGIPTFSDLDETKVKHTYVNDKAVYKMDYIQGMAIGADGSLYVMDIYPQLNVVCFPKLTAPEPRTK